MSTQRLAILAAVGTSNLMRNTTGEVERHPNGRGEHTTTYGSIGSEQQRGNQFHGNVNVLLGG